VGALLLLDFNVVFAASAVGGALKAALIVRKRGKTAYLEPDGRNGQSPIQYATAGQASEIVRQGVRVHEKGLARVDQSLPSAQLHFNCVRTSDTRICDSNRLHCKPKHKSSALLRVCQASRLTGTHLPNCCRDTALVLVAQAKRAD
jgi:hypothetical protein